MTALALLQQEYFAPTDTRVAPEDFFVLAAHVTQCDKTFLLAHPEYCLTPEMEAALREALKRRIAHEPVAYITGVKEFYGRDYLVTNDTLIPRPETELLVEEVVKSLSHTDQQALTTYDIVDIGTGSGNIILSIALESEKIFPVPDIRFYAIDISDRALAIAKKNALHLEIKSQIHFLQSDLLVQFRPSLTEARHLIVVANLPYLSTTLWQASMTDVKTFEPKSALESGPDGLDHYRRLLNALINIRTNYAAITFLLEISPEQDEMLSNYIFSLLPQATLDIQADLSGRSRLIRGVF